MEPLSLITDPQSLKEAAAELSKVDQIAVDTEFIRETSFFPKIAVIQVASETQSWLIDPTAFSKEEMEPFLAVLRDPAILKIMHAAHGDQECFFWAYDMVAEPVFDTCVGAALCGLGDSAGLARLLREKLGVQLKKGRARVKWLARPLSQDLLRYAEQDVAHLVGLGKSLQVELERLSRWEWAVQASEILPSQFDVSPHEIAQRLAKSGNLDETGFWCLQALVEWRENRARRANLPRPWVADNETLVALAKSRPKSLDELRSFRGIKGKEFSKQGEMILEAIRSGEAHPRGEYQPPKKMPRRQDSDEHALELMKAFVAFLAAKHSIAPRYLLPSAKAAVLVRSSEKPMEYWVEQGILSEQSAALVGEDLQGFLNGKEGLALNNGRVELIKIK